MTKSGVHEGLEDGLSPKGAPSGSNGLWRVPLEAIWASFLTGLMRKSVDPSVERLLRPVSGIGFTLSPYPLSLHNPLPATWHKTRKNTYKMQNITFCQHVRR